MGKCSVNEYLPTKGINSNEKYSSTVLREASDLLRQVKAVTIVWVGKIPKSQKETGKEE